MNLITKIILLIISILSIIITLAMYLVIIGGNLNKSENERFLEDEEQMKYLRKIK